MKFTHKIILSPILASAAFLIVFIMTLINGFYNRSLLNKINHGYFPAVELSRDLEESLTQIQKGLQDAAAAADEDLLKETDLKQKAFLERMSKEKNNITIEAKELANIEKVFNRYYAQARQNTLTMIRGQSEGKLQNSLEQMLSDYNRLRKTLGGFSARQKQDMDKAFTRARFFQIITFVMIGGTNIICIIMFIVVYFNIVKSVTNPIISTIGKLNSSAKELTGAAEELTLAGRRIALGANDQARSLKDMAVGLEELSRRTRSNADTFQQVKVRSDEAFNSTEKAGQLTRENAEHTDEASKRAREAAVGMGEVVEATRQNVANVALASRIAAEGSTAAEKSREALAGMSEAIETIKSSALQTSQVVQVIKDIADEIHLLSLNARIQASRAGAAGRSFAVVAEAIQNLARKSSDEAQNTSELVEASQKSAEAGAQAAAVVGETLQDIIKSVQNVTRNIGTVVDSSKMAMESLEKSVGQVQETEQLVQKVSGTGNEMAALLYQLTDSIQKVAHLNADVSQAGSDQADNIEHINLEVVQMEGVTQNNVLAVNNSEAINSKVANQAEELNSIVKLLVSIVEGEEIKTDSV